MPEENMQVANTQENMATVGPELDDNTSAAALSHATYLSEGLLREQNPMVDMESTEEPEEQPQEENGKMSDELQSVKDEIASIREMLEEALGEDVEEKENEQK